MPDAAPLDEQLAELGRRLAALERERDTASSERDEYKQLYVTMLEAYRKLEAGLVRHPRERVVMGGEQTTLGLLSMLTGGTPTPGPTPTTTVNAHERVKPTGRKPLPPPCCPRW